MSSYCVDRVPKPSPAAQKRPRASSSRCRFFGRLGRAPSPQPRGVAVTNSSVLHPILEAITSAVNMGCNGRARQCVFDTAPHLHAGKGSTKSSTIVSNNGRRFICAAVRSDEEQLGAALDEALAASTFLTPMTGYSMIVIAVAHTRVHMGLLSLLRLSGKEKVKDPFTARRGLYPFYSSLKRQLTDVNVHTVPFIAPEVVDGDCRSDSILQYAITFDAATVRHDFEDVFKQYLLLLVDPIACGLRHQVCCRHLGRHAMRFSKIPAIFQLPPGGDEGAAAPEYECRVFPTDNYKRVISVHKKAGRPFYACMVCPQSEETALEFPPQSGNTAGDSFLMCCYRLDVPGVVYGSLPFPPAAAKLLAIIDILHEVHKVAHGNIQLRSIFQNSELIALDGYEHGTSLAAGEVCLPTGTLAAAALEQFISKLSPERQQVLLSDEGLLARLMDILAFFLFVWLEYDDLLDLNDDDDGDLKEIYEAMLLVVNSPDVDGGTPTRDIISRILETIPLEELQKVKHVIEEHALFEKRSMEEVNAAFTVPEWR